MYQYLFSLSYNIAGNIAYLHLNYEHALHKYEKALEYRYSHEVHENYLRVKNLLNQQKNNTPVSVGTGNSGDDNIYTLEIGQKIAEPSLESQQKLSDYIDELNRKGEEYQIFFRDK
ncbi:hypothetical protein MK079_02620 [Candidatus Gracilibacteria bacterium]|nr:hypothetical protein [Candidatus Gracilibacteria bacterium]